MKHLQKLISLLLALTVACCCFVTASAATAADPVVGVLTIHSVPYFSDTQGGSSSSSGIDAGHAFLSFKNTYSSPITVGALSVGRGSETTFGTWDISVHRGVWYNLEAFCINHKGKMPNRVSLFMKVTMSDIETINSVIEKNDKWNLFVNCSTFASKVWNSVSSTKLFASLSSVPDTPAVLASIIILQSNYEKNSPIADAKFCGYMEINDDGYKVFKSANWDEIFVGNTANSLTILNDADFIVLDNPFSINEVV